MYIIDISVSIVLLVLFVHDGVDVLSFLFDEVMLMRMMHDQGNLGKLVTDVKNKLLEAADHRSTKWMDEYEKTLHGWRDEFQVCRKRNGMRGEDRDKTHLLCMMQLDMVCMMLMHMCGCRQSRHFS